MSNLVERLRELADMPCLSHGKPDTTFEEAADEISRLSCEAKRAYEAGFYAGWDWGAIDDLPIDGETIEKHWREFSLEEQTHE